MTALDQIERQLRDATVARRRRRRARPLLVLTLAAACVAAVVVLDGGAPPPTDEREVSAPSVAYLAPDPDKIVYVHATTVHTDQEGRRDVFVTEEWHRGRETHRIVSGTNSDGSTAALDHVIDEHGVMRQIAADTPAGAKPEAGAAITGDYRVFHASRGGDAANVIASEQAGYLADFRTRFEQGTLDPAEQLVFAGRPARRYRVASDPARFGPHTPDQAYYVDRDTGAPLGFTSQLRVNRKQVAMTSTQTVDSIEILDPTPANLAKLRTLTFKRR
jgi:hypothetical protein